MGPTKLYSSRKLDSCQCVAGSLKSGTIRASELLRSLLRSKRPSTLARAIGELGKIPKTLYLLTYIDDETYRRRILIQLNRHEDRHQLAKATLQSYQLLGTLFFHTARIHCPRAIERLEESFRKRTLDP